MRQTQYHDLRVVVTLFCTGSDGLVPSGTLTYTAAVT